MAARRTVPPLRRLLGVTAVAAALPLALTGSVVAQTSVLGAQAAPETSAPTPVRDAGTDVWKAQWLGTTPGTGGTTLADVRTVTNGVTPATYNGAGVGIALIDTGVSPVPGLPASQIVNGPDLSFESQSTNLRYLDTYGHGTHMAGIIVGNDPSTGTVGLAPKAKLTSVKVASANGSTDVSQVIAAIDWVVANRNHDPSNPIKVINLSYGSGGTPGYGTDPLSFAVEQAWKAGIVVVAAAGNDGNNVTTLNDPAMDPFVISVGATDTMGTPGLTDDTLTTFTNIPTLPNSLITRGIDIVAPGSSIVSLRDEGSNIDESYPSARVGTTLFRGSGTSQAAAVVSAAIALMLQQRPGLTPSQIKQMVLDTGIPLAAGLAGQRQLRSVNVLGAVSAPVPLVTQSWTSSTGTGTLEASRGVTHAMIDSVGLKGEKTVWGPFNATSWASASAAKTSWNKGLWTGYRLAGDGWAGAGGTLPTGQVSGLGGKCLQVANNSSTNGTAIQLNDCAIATGQTWTIQTDGTIRALGKCLDLTGGATANGTKLVLSDCKGTTQQKWTVTTTGQLKNTLAARCADVLNGSSNNGTAVQLKDCTAIAGQQWGLPFASKTWGAANWTATPWSGTSWFDSNWTGRYWSGRYWSGRYWSGRYWSSDTWK